jgi:hypothetical protein
MVLNVPASWVSDRLHPGQQVAGAKALRTPLESAERRQDRTGQRHPNRNGDAQADGEHEPGSEEGLPAEGDGVRELGVHLLLCQRVHPVEFLQGAVVVCVGALDLTSEGLIEGRSRRREQHVADLPALLPFLACRLDQRPFFREGKRSPAEVVEDFLHALMRLVEPVACRRVHRLLRNGVVLRDHGALDEELEALDNREFLRRLFDHVVESAGDALVREERNGRQPDERQQHDPHAE